MSLLRDRRLAALLAAEVASSIGTQMTWLALPWFALRSTGSPQRMTWVIIAEILPVALLGFWGGAIAARLGTRRTMLICDLARAAPRRDSAARVARPALVPPAARTRRRDRRVHRPVLRGSAGGRAGARGRGAARRGRGDGVLPGG